MGFEHMKHLELENQLEDLSDNSRIWIFQSDKEILNSELKDIQAALNNFAKEWTSHNAKLHAKILTLYGYFIVVILDEEASSHASGCSIDSLTRKIQSTGEKFGLNLLHRESFYFLIDEKIRPIAIGALTEARDQGEINRDSLVFNNLIQKKSDLLSKWIVPVRESWHRRFI